jgi:nicotinamidase-related amidase
MSLDPARTALVLIDLMDRIIANPLEPRPGPEVLERSLELATAFRKAGATVVAVRVDRPNVTEQPPGSDFAAGVVEDGDVVIVKNTIGAFHNTGLDEQLRERGVGTLVFAGIATNLGVESSARAASDLGYDLVFAEDAMSAFTAAEHEAAVTLDLPRFGTVTSSAELMADLA